MYGASTPAGACVAPMPTGRSSTISTDAPRAASSWATAQPMMPAPTTMMSEGGVIRFVYTPTTVKQQLVNGSIHQFTSSPIQQFLQVLSRVEHWQRDKRRQRRGAIDFVRRLPVLPVLGVGDVGEGLWIWVHKTGP